MLNDIQNKELLDKYYRNKMYTMFQNKGAFLTPKEKDEVKRLMKQHADARNQGKFIKRPKQENGYKNYPETK